MAVTDVPGVPTDSAAGLGSTGSARVTPGHDWESDGQVPNPDIPAATSRSGVMTSLPPSVLPVGIFPADVIDVVFEHPAVEVSVLTEMLLARSEPVFPVNIAVMPRHC